MSRITQLFEKVFSEKSNDNAFVFCEKGRLCTRTFGQLEADVRLMRHHLHSTGAQKGDRILVFAKPCYKLCALMIASLMSGISVMYVDIWAKQDRLKNAFQSYRPDYVAVSDSTRYLRFLFREIGRIKSVINIDRTASADETSSVTAESDEQDIALLTMTTGSTGTPKIAVRTHHDLYEQIKLTSANMQDMPHSPVVLTTSYIYVFANILSGFCTVLPQLDLKKKPAAIDKKLAVFSGIPIDAIITSPDFCLKARNVFPKLKTLYLGGAILNPYEARTILHKFGSADIVYIYGATECNLICCTSLSDYLCRLEKEGVSCLGHPADGVQVRCTDADEILVSSDALLENYLTADRSNKVTDENNRLWHSTGDCGMMEDGQLLYFGRSDRKLTLNGKTMYSSQLEQDIARRFSSIRKCAVLQKDDTVFVFVEGGLDKAALQEYLGGISIKLIQLKHIPCDVKHHTKINYRKLEKRMHK